MPNEQDGKLKFGRSYVYLDPDSLASTPDAATPGVWRVKSGVDNSGDPSIGVVNAVNTRTGNVTLTSADVGLANVNNTSDVNKPVSTAQQTALNAKIDTTTANSTLLGITAKAADSELLDGLNSTSFVQTNTQFGGDVSGAYNAIVIADDSHNHIISNVDGLQTALDIKADLVGGVVPTNQLPAIAITEYLGSVSSQSALLALSGQKGDWAIRSDTSTTWIITGTTPSNIGSWTELQYPAAPVSSVNGATGTVVLGHSDVGAASTAQGTTADSAIQPGDNISQLTNNSGFISATLTDEEVQDIVGGMVSGNTESGITVTYQDTDGTIDFDVATQSDNNFTTVLKDKLDAIEVSATADQTASEIITSLLTVDGANSGLDSDLLDGQHGSYYLDYTNFTNTPTFENANKLDNLDSTQFLRSDAADVKTSGTLNFSDDVKLTLGTSDDLEIYHDGTNSYIDDTGTGNLIIGSANLQLTNVAHTENFITATDNGSVDLYYDANKKFETTNTGATVTGTLTATAFSGAGGNVTGVNASQLNSQNAAYYLDYSNFSNTPTIPTNNNQLTNGAGYLTSPDGGDAITLDGLDSTDFLRSNADDTFTGELTVSGNLLLSDQVRIGDDAWIEDFDGANAIRVKGNTDSTQGYIAFGNRTEKLGCNNSATLSYDGNTIWNAGNDGSGSGLDADTVDGLNPKVSSTASSIAVRDGSSDISLRTVKSTFADETTISGAVGYRINNSTDNSLRFCSDMSAVRSHIGTNNASNLTTGTIPIARISGGAGTGLDADLLDGVQGSSYLRSDANDSASGVIDFLGGTGGTSAVRVKSGGNSWSEGIALHPSADTGYALTFFRTTASLTSNTNTWAIGNLGVNGTNNFGLLRKDLTGSSAIRSDAIFDITQAGVFRFGFGPKVGANAVWHAGNDGAASGLDADLLDGQHGSYYLNYNNLTNLPAGAGGGTDIGAGNSKAEIIDTGTDGRFIVTTEGTERMRIDSSGAIGIGRTPVNNTAGYVLQLRGNSSQSYLQLSTATHGNTLGDGLVIGTDNSTANIIQRENAPLTFFTNNAERLRIDSSGRLLVGVSTAPTATGAQFSNFVVQGASAGSAFDGRMSLSRGTAAASLADGSVVGNIFFTDIGSNEFASISAAVDGTTGSSDAPGSLQFSTTSDGASSPTERLRIDSSGRVGIGTTSPSAPLDVVGNDGIAIQSSSQTNEFLIRPNNNNADGIRFTQAGGAGDRMVIDSSGKVGIGTTSPNQLFDVAGTIAQTVAGTTRLRLENTTVSKYFDLRNDGGLFVTDNGTEKMRLDSSGKVGIGTSSPGYKLHVKDGSGTAYRSLAWFQGTGTHATAGFERAVALGSSNDGAHIDGWNGTSGARGNTHLLLQSAGGNVGIGTTSPARQLTVYDASTPIIQLANSTTGVTANDGVMLYESGSNFIIENQEAGEIKIYNNGSQRATIDSSGRVGIDQPNPTNTLHVGGAGASLRVGPNYTSSGDRDFVLLQAHGTDSYIRSNNERFHIYNSAGDIIFHRSSDIELLRLNSADAAIVLNSASGSNPGTTTASFEKGVTVTGGNQRVNIDCSSTTNGGAYIQVRHSSTIYPQYQYPLKLNPIGGTVSINGNTAWHAGNDGAGSGLDADNLDGKTWNSSGKDLRGTEIYADNWFRNYNSGEGLYNQATGCHFVSDASEQWTIRDSGNSIRINFKTNGSTQRASVYADNTPSIGFLNSNNEWGLRYLSNNGNSPNLYFREQGNELWTGNPDSDVGKIEYHSNRFYIVSGSNSTEVVRFRRSGSNVGYIDNSGNMYLTSSNHKVWTAGNDGSGSGLDADTLDGVQASSFLNGSADVTINGMTVGIRGNSENTAVGYEVLNSNQYDSANTAFGYRCLKSTTWGPLNTAIGWGALQSNTTGKGNAALGYSALYSNTTGTYNVAVGHSALYSNTTGWFNVANGQGALVYNTTGWSNVAVGESALRSNTTGGSNTGIGAYALYNSNSSNNIAVGPNSGYWITNGHNNVCIGVYAGAGEEGGLTTGDYNTLIGTSAGENISTGNNNSCIGRGSNPSSGGVSNQVTLGNSSISSLRCNDTSISGLSDARDKVEVEDLPLGLEFLTTLRPIKFKWETRDGNIKDGTYDAGFLAQDLQAAQESADADYLRSVQTDNPERLEAAYGRLLPVIVQALKDANDKISAMEIEIKSLKGS